MSRTELIEGLYTKRELVVQSQPKMADIQLTHLVNSDRPPFIISTQILTVPVSSTQQLLYSATLPANVELHGILIIPTSNSATNGVTFYLNYGNNSIGDQHNPSGIMIPLTIGFDSGDYPMLLRGSNISLYGLATTSGSGLQLVLIGVFV